MFDHTHYVCGLRWKRGEQHALSNLFSNDRSRLTPLIEPPTKPFLNLTRRQLDAELYEVAKQILDSWGARPFFVDLRYLPNGGRTAASPRPMVVLAQHALDVGLAMIPVTDAGPTTDTVTAAVDAAHLLGQGLSIRFPAARNPTELTSFLNAFSLSPENCDLILDFGVLDDSPLALLAILSCIPSLLRWRTLTVLAGSFPPNLTGLAVGQHELPRLEWVGWRSAVTLGPTLPRRPTFGDFTTQHPVYTEPPGLANFSASIRYAADDYWVVMRGEGVRNVNGAGYAQWPANASLLVARPEFRGPNFSAGDGYIHSMQMPSSRNGNAETWLRAGVNHHLTLVVRQLEQLFGS